MHYSISGRTRRRALAQASERNINCPLNNLRISEKLLLYFKLILRITTEWINSNKFCKNDMKLER